MLADAFDEGDDGRAGRRPPRPGLVARLRIDPLGPADPDRAPGRPAGGPSRRARRRSGSIRPR